MDEHRRLEIRALECGEGARGKFHSAPQAARHRHPVAGAAAGPELTRAQIDEARQRALAGTRRALRRQHAHAQWCTRSGVGVEPTSAGADVCRGRGRGGKQREDGEKGSGLHDWPPLTRGTATSIPTRRPERSQPSHGSTVLSAGHTRAGRVHRRGQRAGRDGERDLRRVTVHPQSIFASPLVHVAPLELRSPADRFRQYQRTRVRG